MRQTIDAKHVRGEFANAGYRISAVLTFNEAGDLVNFRSDDRHQVDGVIDRPVPWLTPLSDYRMFGNARLAKLGQAHWIEGNEAWAFGKFVLQHIEYNVH
ncbi:MAG: DUF6544 family protein [Gemmatimonas sp.]